MLLALALLATASCSLGFDDEYPIFDEDEGSDDGGRPPDAAPEDGALPEAGSDGGGAGEAGVTDGGDLMDAGCGDAAVDDAGACPIDPCAGVTCNANATCAASAEAPGYTCTCNAGYEQDGETCVDVDECFQGTYDCHLSATCANTEGGYDCTCPLGYVGGGLQGVACTPRIVAGNAHVCTVLESGRVQCWGSNAGRALGDGSEIDRPTPAPVVALEGVVGMASYNVGNCAIVESGEVHCWGNDLLEVQPVPNLDDVIAVSTCTGHSCAVQRDGAVQCWGNNDAGQIGNGEMSPTPVTEPEAVVGLDGPAIGVHVIDRQSCAVLDGGDVQCWGTGFLGDADYMSSLAPVNVVTTNVLALASGGYHWCALLGNRQLHCWGNQALFGGTSGTALEPVIMSGVTNVSAVHVQVYRTHALLGDHTIRWWDAGVAPMTVPGVSTAVAVGVGNRLACALLDDGTATCWEWVNPGDVPAPMTMADVDLW